MNNNTVSYIKTDKNIIINEKCIKWVQKMDECLEICTKSDGCSPGLNTHRLCKINNPDSYEKINKHFK
jgi:hypothetical protein